MINNDINNQEKSSKGRHLEEIEELIEFKKYLKRTNKSAYLMFTKLKVNSSVELLESTFNMYSKVLQARNIDDE